MRFRFLIADLMVLSVLGAILAYAYQKDPALFAFVAFSAYLAAICLASLAAKFRQGNRKLKMFFKGFALFGWFYFVFGLLPTLAGSDTDAQLNRTAIGLGLAFVCGYATSRLGTHHPCPGRQRADEAAPAPAGAGFPAEAGSSPFESRPGLAGMLRQIPGLSPRLRAGAGHPAAVAGATRDPSRTPGLG